ncbi:hypothetical protein [Streptomyces sp. 6N223]|uniref:hypothetical protein n=1 Tax=Streptomyces sp. 6N223 TaxID=3457412 RepID=UPI003FD67E73
MRVGSVARGVARGAVVGVVATATAVALPAATASAWPSQEWEVVSAGELGTSAYLGAVSAAGPTAAWAAGYQVIDAQPRGVLMRWDGWQWRPDDAPGLPEVIYWLDVSAVSPHDVWAYGRVRGEEYVMAHFDGWRWETAEMPEEPDGGSYGVTDVEAVHGRTWLSGDEAISTYADGEWETLDLGSGVNIVDLDARTARDAWAVGPYWPTGQAQERRPMVLHWDGGDWSEIPLDRPELRPEHVYAESRDSVYVVARSYESGESGDPNHAVVLHWDGHGWEEIRLPLSGMYVDAISGDGHGTVWLGGDPAGWEGPPVFWRYDAREESWTEVTGETVPGHTQAHRVTDLAPIGLTGGYWAVGSYSLITEPGRSQERELIHHAWR